jgi:predicted ATPase
MLASFPFHATVFVLPPWQAIYANDAERDQSLAEAVDVHARVIRIPSARSSLLKNPQPAKKL